MRPSAWVRFPLALTAIVSLSPALAAQGRRDTTPPPPVLRFQYMGPPSAGRIASVAGVAGDPSTYYAGAASGGVWKTVDSGRTFAPVFDSEPVQAIGALAVAPSDPKIVWAGTGEAWVIRDADMMGDGVYKSTDGGTTWTHMGLEQTGRIGRIIVNPTNPDIVFVCALGRTTDPQQERGVFRTMDGGKSWTRVLFVNPHTGCSGLSMDAQNPNVLYAGTWQIVMHTWAMFSGGPGSGVYKSVDGGTTWTRLSAGLPKSPVGKVDVAVAPSDSNRVYALIETPNQGSLWRSDDAGKTWKVASWDRTLIGRAGYYIRLAVNPTDADEVMVANSSFHRSTDGGLTFPEHGGCGDCHDIWVDPTNPDRWVLTDDGGMNITTTHGKHYDRIALPIGQMYHVAIDDRIPYWIYSNRQDDGTMRGRSDAPVVVDNVPSYRRGRGRFYGGPDWQNGLGGCESGFTLPDPSDAQIVWASCYGNTVTRFDGHIDEARSVSPWRHTLDYPPNDAKYRCHWTPPLAIDPFDHNTVYYGCQVIFKTSDGGQTWTAISPDLSTRDSSRIVSSGGLIGDNLGQFYGEVVFAIAPSPVERGLIWAGTNDGKIWYTKDGGGTWNDVTANVSDMAPWGIVREIAPSPFDAATAYVAVDYHLMGDRRPYIYKTTDFGKTWTRISDGLPQEHPLDYVMTVTENPNRRGMLFAGTGHAFFYSLDDGGHWTRFEESLPAAPVSWIVVSKPFHDVVISTYGRGLWVLRDITPLEQSDGSDATAQVRLYRPPAGYRLGRSGRADITFAVDSAPHDSVAVEIVDSTGTVIRTLRDKARAGLNRVDWDVRYDGPAQVALRTVAPDNPNIWSEPRFKGDSTRPVVHWGTGEPQRVGPLALPGSYTIRLVAGDDTLAQPLELLKDPTIPSSDSALALSTATQIRIRNDMDSTVHMINRLEIMRKQIADERAAHARNRRATRALDQLASTMMAVELQLLSRSNMESDDKWYVEASKVYMNLVWLSAEVGTGGGDVAGGADYPPTAAQLAVLAQLEGRLANAARDYATLVTRDVPAFNRAMRGTVKPIAVP